MTKRDAILVKVLAVLRSGAALTGAQIASKIGHPYATGTVTAKIRDLRKKRYGRQEIRCVRCSYEETGNGYIYRYYLVA